MALLVYALGVRHAFDIDHIAAIDNTVRRLLEQRRNASGVRFFFALGHPSVVFLTALLLAVATRQAQQFLPWFTPIGGVIGPTVSDVFLLLIVGLNALILWDLGRALGRFRRGQDANLELQALPGGLWTRVAAPLLQPVSRSVHLYPLGFSGSASIRQVRLRW
jgi:high-affinity nickel-transport protein